MIIVARTFGFVAVLAGVYALGRVAVARRGAPKLLVALAGSLAAWLFVVLFSAVSAVAVGVRTPVPGAVVTSLPAGSAAEAAGLRAGDLLLTVDGAPFETGHVYAAGREAKLEVVRDGATIPVRVTPRLVDGRARLGVVLGTASRDARLGPAAALAHAVALSAWPSVGAILRTIEPLVPDSGPVGFRSMMLRDQTTGDTLDDLASLGALLVLLSLLPAAIATWRLRITRP